MLPQPSQPAVHLLGVTKRLGGKTIVENLEFSVHPGEVFGLLGPNGAGKTTSIRLMVGLIAPSAGEILIHGHSIRTDFAKAIAHVGAVVETPAVYGFLTGWQNLVHYAGLAGRIPEGRLREIVSLLGLGGYIHDKAATYSLGMRQRLGIAQALLHQPGVLILDEPTNGLDPAGIKELREHLRGLAERQGTAVIVSSHILAEMELLCDRTAVIKGGRLLGLKDLRRTEGEAVQFTVDDTAKAAALVRASFPRLALSCTDDRLSVDADREQAAAVNAGLAGAGVKIYAMQPKAKTLEEIYLALTGEDGHV